MGKIIVIDKSIYQRQPAPHGGTAPGKKTLGKIIPQGFRAAKSTEQAAKLVGKRKTNQRRGSKSMRKGRKTMKSESKRGKGETAMKMRFKNRPKNKRKGFLAVRNGSGQIGLKVARGQPTPAAHVDGGPGEYVQSLHFLEKQLLRSRCKCPSRDECIHYWSVTQAAWERTFDLTNQEIMIEKAAEIPEAIGKLIAEYRLSESALKKTLATIAANLPPKKSRRLIGRLHRYQNEHIQVQNKFLTSVAYVKGVADHDWVIHEQLAVIEEQLKQLRSHSSREFYKKTFLENPHFVQNELAFGIRLKRDTAAAAVVREEPKHL